MRILRGAGVWNAPVAAWFLRSVNYGVGVKYHARAPAKINLGLWVLRRNRDGYHSLATVFYPIGWSDTLSVSTGSELKLTCSFPAVSCGEGNLVMRAARLLDKEKQGCASMHLDKKIPMGAGLGGGSSNAATALRLLARLWGLSPTEDEFRRYALELGSDVPFFLDPVPSFATGRGEQLTRMSEVVLPYSLVVAVPRIHVSTAWAFSRIRPNYQRRPKLENIVHSMDLGLWSEELTNDFEPVVFEEYPEIAKRKADMLNWGADYASLTGTGAAVYGLFKDKLAARNAATSARNAGCNVYVEGPREKPFTAAPEMIRTPTFQKLTHRNENGR